MARARDVLEAEEQADRERWQCLTCSQPADENSDHCMHCVTYWDDVSNGLYDRDDEIATYDLTGFLTDLEMEPLGTEFEKIWDDNVGTLYKA